MKRLMKALLMALSIMLMLGLAGASQYAFGTKVTSVDTDFGSPLHPYGPPNPIPYFSIGYWETGVVNGYDDTDVVYLHQGSIPPFPTVLANDVRLTPFGNLPAGSKVTPQDNDIGMPLALIPATTGGPGNARIAWVNLYGGPGHDLDDPVYLHQGNIFPNPPGIPTTTNDVRLTSIGGNQPGTKVRNLDPDLPLIFAPPVIGSSPNPIAVAAAGGVLAPIGSVLYVDVNGNNQYDYPDDVYLITGLPPSPAVRVNDVRLSGP